MIHQRPHTTAAAALTTPGPLRPGAAGVTLSMQLSASLQHLARRITPLPEPYSCCVLFFTVAAQGARSRVFFVRRSTLEAAWREGTTRVRQWAWARQLSAVELRIDWPNEVMVIGRHIPALSQWGPASAWALADDDLEHAELLSSVALSEACESPPGTRCQHSTIAHPLALLAEVNLLLRLQGLHMGEDGVHTALPKVHPAPHRPPPSPMPGMPLAGPDAPLCEQQPGNGHGLPGFACDRRCVTHALLLTQQHIAATELAQADVILAIERAFHCVEKNIDSLRARADACYMDQTMCLMIFTRYLCSRNPGGAFNHLAEHMERLARHLTALRNMPSDSGA